MPPTGGGGSSSRCSSAGLRHAWRSLRRTATGGRTAGSTCMSSTDIDELNLHLPASAGPGLDQDREWCEVDTADGRRRIRFHDYAEIYAIPGLYERLFYDELRCQSPSTVRGLLEQVLEAEESEADDLVVLDLGSG